MWDSRYNWCFHTDPEPTMNGRRIYWPTRQDAGRLKRDQRSYLHTRAA